MTKKAYPRWLYPRTTDLLPLTAAEIGGRLSASTRAAQLTDEQMFLRMSRLSKLARKADMRNHTPEQRSASARKAALARAAKLTPERRSEIARMGAAAARLKTTPEQRSQWARAAGLRSTSKRWGTT